MYEEKTPSPMSEEKQTSKFNEFFLFLNITLLLCSVALLIKIAYKATNISAQEERLVLANKEDQEFYDFARTFSETYNIIRSNHVDESKVDAKNLLLGALNGMFQQLDPHSQYMAWDNFNQLTKDTEAQYSGVGIHISMRDNVLTVISPMPGSPSPNIPPTSSRRRWSAPATPPRSRSA